MKRIVLFLMLALCLLCAWATGGTYSGGAGTSASPYQITTLNDLIELNRTSADWASGKYFELTGNVDMEDTSVAGKPALYDAVAAHYVAGDRVTWQGATYLQTYVCILANDHGTPHAPADEVDNTWWRVAWYTDRATLSGFAAIGTGLLGKETTYTSVVGFGGYFNGGGHTLSNMTATCTGAPYCTGLFGPVTDTGIIENVNMATITLTGKDRTGAVAGHNMGIVRDCVVTGVTLTMTGVDSQHGGGLCGINNGTLLRCSTTGTASSSYTRIGGLAGQNGGNWLNNAQRDSNGVIFKCNSSVAITACQGESGGLVGTNYGNILSSYSTGNVTGNDFCTSLGGFVGLSNDGIISHCYSTGNVLCLTADTNSASIGGFCGEGSSNASVTRVNYCYSTGSVTYENDTGETAVGGFWGRTGTVFMDHCYSTGAVHSDGDQVGGLVGYMDGSGIVIAGQVTNCWSSSPVTGDNDVGGLIGFVYGNGVVDKCYAKGLVVGATNAGGLIGDTTSNACTNSFWDNQTTNQATSDGGADCYGTTTANMALQATYTDQGWTFSNSQWYMSGGYPKFYFPKYAAIAR